MKRFALIIAGILVTSVMLAQTTKQEVIDNPAYTRAHYSSYPVPTEALTPAPEGYTPVYISHYGRHGSRYHTSRSNHTNAYKILKEAKEADLLTSFGKSVYKKVKELRSDAKGRDGGLSPLGTQEHKGIAERMYKAFPEVFSGNAIIDCRSTESPRCILSMAANNERLKELNPSLRIYRSAYEGDEDFLRREKYQKENKKDMGSAKKQLQENLDATEFAKRIFKDGISDILDDKEMVKFMKYMYAIYQITDCTSHTGINLDDVFTPEELFTLWEATNAGNYAHCGNSQKHGKGVLKDAKPLLKDFIERADDALEGNGISADLRFGHDIAIAPLAALLNINGYGARTNAVEEAYKVWADFIVMPMGTNLQLIYYKNATGDILVKILYNEKESTIPGLKTVNGPYYDWKDLRQYFVNLLK